MIGTQLGPYLIEAQLGRGGMATVYRAVHVPLRRSVALKVLDRALSENAEFRQRFEQEAKVAASLDHPNIVPVFDLGTTDGYQYIAMRLIEGRALDAVIRESGRMPATRVLSIGAEIADALAYAHNERVLHRDVKPSNVLLRPDDHPMLTDFGIARAAEFLGLTRSNSIVGTPRYMSPEQALAQTVDHRSDLYSLGVLLYEMLAGRVPFDATSTPSMLYMHVHEPPRPLNLERSDLSAGVRELVERCLAKSPDDRYQSAGEVAATCRALLAVLGHDAATRTVVWPRQSAAEQPPRADTPPAAPGGWGPPPSVGAPTPPGGYQATAPWPAVAAPTQHTPLPMTPAGAPPSGTSPAQQAAGGSPFDRLRATVPLPLLGAVAGLVVIVGLWALLGDRIMGRNEPGSAAAPTATVRPTAAATTVAAAAPTPTRPAGPVAASATAPAKAPSPAADTPAARLSEAMSALGRRDWSSALAQAEAGLKADPNNPGLAKAAVQAHLGLAQQHLTQGALRDALLHYSTVREAPLRATASAAELREADLSAPYIWGEIMAGTDLSLALFEYDKTFRRDPAFRDVRQKLYDGNITLARQALARSDNEAATRYVNNAQRIDPSRPDAQELSRQLTGAPR